MLNHSATAANGLRPALLKVVPRNDIVLTQVRRKGTKTPKPLKDPFENAERRGMLLFFSNKLILIVWADFIVCYV